MSFVAVPGTRIGDYVVVSEIGRGGMAVVYLAEHPDLGRKVALKVLSPELAEDDGFRDRFVREARLAAGIEHPNIVPVYDAGEAEGLLYIAMRYVEGPDLAKQLVRERSLSLERTIGLLGQVAAALDAAHAKGLVHRDIKPSNILLARGESSGGGDHAYLADFGLARPQLGVSSHTQAGELYGTVDYMAPEQLDGRSPDARTDVYAFSCLAYECLVGEPPFHRDTAIATASAHLYENPVPPSDRNPGFPRSVSETILRGLAKDKASRYPSAGVMVADLIATDESQNESHATRPGRRSSDPALPSAALREERKVVTALACAMQPAGGTDPEDWRAMFVRLESDVKREIERFGGQVLGGVAGTTTGIFGAPIAHEDDAERAVRAGLSIREEISISRDAGGAAVRIGISTGGALVSPGGAAAPTDRTVSGEVVASASRIGASATIDEVVVDERTYRLTKETIHFDVLSVVDAGGVSTQLWRAIAPTSRLGSETDRTDASSFVGRDDELELLRRTYSRARREHDPQLVVVTGEPGVGKSRLIRELASWMHDLPEIVTWRQGRCLPYGEGITFWALGEIVKAHAGIFETDRPELVLTKLEAAVSLAIETIEDRSWVVDRLRGLAGAAGGQEQREVTREELFAAWLQFFESIADHGPMVLVFEDLHWAEPALLEFIEHLSREAAGVPILVICTARPELRERHPTFARDVSAVAWVPLPALSGNETAELVVGILGAVDLPNELRDVLLAQAGGNPLFAEQFTNFLIEQSILIPKRGIYELAKGSGIPVPDGVTAVIAARLDTLSSDRKRLLHDAAVVGKVFWAGAVAKMSGVDVSDVRSELRELARKELVRRVRRSSVEGDEEYGFWHALTRDTAYAQIPKRERVMKHLAVADWIEHLAEDQKADQSDLIAHHLGEAYKLQAAAGENVSDLRTRYCAALVAAGDQLVQLDASAALERFRLALTLLENGALERGPLLIKAAQMEEYSGHFESALAFVDEAIRICRVNQMWGDLAEALFRRSNTLYMSRGDFREAERDIKSALSLQQSYGSKQDLASAQERYAFFLTVAGRPAEAIGLVDQAYEAGAESAEREGSLLNVRGSAKVDLGDEAGVRDLERAQVLLQSAGLEARVGYVTLNLGLAYLTAFGPNKAEATLLEADSMLSRRGFEAPRQMARLNLADLCFDAGRWHECLAVFSSAREFGERYGFPSLVLQADASEVAIAWMRGDHVVPPTDFEVEAKNLDPMSSLPWLTAQSIGRLALGDSGGAAESMAETIEVTERAGLSSKVCWLPERLRTCRRLSNVDLAESMVKDISTPSAPRMRAAIISARSILAEMRSLMDEAVLGYSEAMPLWDEYGCVVELAHAQVGAGRALIGLGRGQEAGLMLRKARATWVDLEARRLVADVNELLQDGSVESQ